jgi:imidazole glycerol-phosphate synthase subunit HisH
MENIVIVDYGSGNVFSVAMALKNAGITPVLSSNPDVIAKADRMILPGVGAFGAAWALLQSSNLIEPIRAFIANDRPFMGICVGMQMLLDSSDEFGNHPGFGLIKGAVSKIANTGINGTQHPVPRVGWYTLSPSKASWAGTILSNVKPNDAVYFVHSYAAVPNDEALVLASSTYNGLPVTAAIHLNNVVGVQFHPEKSGPVGLRIMENFVTL